MRHFDNSGNYGYFYMPHYKESERVNVYVPELPSSKIASTFCEYRVTALQHDHVQTTLQNAVTDDWACPISRSWSALQKTFTGHAVAVAVVTVVAVVAVVAVVTLVAVAAVAVAYMPKFPKALSETSLWILVGRCQAA